ncbi:MAG: ribose-5-phosphate isomerase RpiA, partial [Gammaproteobacteria bacterium]|nr:ribose-5-phosphate isomerase RpiA [Gammaproteobacteria bacterium]
MTQDELKQQVALKALDYIPDNGILGIGSGSTVNFFIAALATKKHVIEATVASSMASYTLLKQHHIPVLEFNQVANIDVYIDGADEINPLFQMIKGGGGCLLREKILATAAKKFVCIADGSKMVQALGAFPLAIEVLPMAQSYVARELVKLGGLPVLRQGFITDNHNIILDVHQLSIHEPIALEEKLAAIPGVLGSGLFAKRPADSVLLA